MPSENIKTPGRRSLLTVAAAAVLLAGVVVGYGFIDRAQSKQEVADWTNAQAIPTVALAQLSSGSPHQTLTLPGNVQPFNRAAIFARVNGYVKSWDHDIGSPVKSGQVLATIDAPDLDQQLSQAKATLASVKANEQIATLTASRNNILVQKQIVAQQLADQTAADATAKQAVVDANEANVRQLEAMQSFKTLAAPFDGVVTARNVELGQLINSGGSGQALFEVSDLHRVRIYVQVPQSFSAGLDCGNEGDIRNAAISGRAIRRDTFPYFQGHQSQFAQHAGRASGRQCSRKILRRQLLQCAFRNSDGREYGDNSVYCACDRESGHAGRDPRQQQ